MKPLFSIPVPLVLFLLLYLAGPVLAGDRVKIVVGGDHGNPPYEFLKNGKPTGFNIELMRAVADAVGADVEFRLGPWSQVRGELEQGKIDALAGMYYSEERSRLVDFSVPHTMVTAGLFVRRDSPLRSIDDIKGKDVIVQKGDAIDDYLRREGIASRLIEVKDPADVLRLLASGRHDCALMPSRFQGEYLIRSLGISNVRVMSANLHQLRYCFAVRKGNAPLKYRLDEGLNILNVNGKYKEIYDKWFGVYEKERLWGTLRYFVWSLAIIVVLLAASAIWSWMLRREVRKRTAELKESEGRLRTLVQTLPDLVWLKDRNGVFLLCNSMFERLYNASEAVIVGKTDYDFVDRELADFFTTNDRKAIAAGKPTVNEEWLTYADDGHRSLVETIKTPVYDGTGGLIGVLGIGRDITQRKQAEEELLENEEKFRVLAETSPAAICVYQEEYHVYVNAAMICLTGYSEQELMKMRFWDWMHPDFRDLVRERGLARQRGEQVPSRYEIRCLSKNGEEKWILVSAGRIEYKGTPAGIVTLIDITDRKRMEDELLEAHDELEIRVEERTAELRRTNELLEEEISERKRTEDALKESESRVRRKLESILDPEGDIGELDLADIIDLPQIQALMEDLYRASGLKMSILDPKGEALLIDAGWQEICRKYHRGHPETRDRCRESDTDFTVGIQPGEFRKYKCKNNMWHLVTPIFVGVRHMGNLFISQFFFENEKIDYDLFRAQARKYGFPEKEYIAALEAVPCYSEEFVDLGKSLFLRLIDMFSRLSYANIKLARSLAERGRLTETLRESEARLKLAMDLAKLGAWEYDADTGMFSFDDQFYALYGTTAEREGGPLMSAEVYARKFIPPEESAVVANGIEEARVNSHFQLEHRIIRADGEERFIVVRGEAIFDQEGRFVKIRGANQDITERKRAEEELRKANVVVENSPVVLFRCKAAPGWPVELVSKNVVQFGYAPEEFLSGELDYSSIVYPRDLAKLIAETEEFSAKGEGQWQQEYRIVTKWGDIRWILDETDCKRNEAGEITHYEGVIIDVTERRKAEEQLILQQMQLKELNRTLEERVRVEVAKNREKDVMLILQNRQAALGEILEHIAHQWKQPLNVLNLIMYVLEDTYSRGRLTDEYVKDVVGKIIAVTENMSQTINVFRDFYRPDKEKTAFSIGDSIEKALLFIKPALGHDSISIELDADPELSAIGYPKEYAQVILNVIANARDALKEQGIENPVIKIRAFAEDKRAVVDITDNAGGIPDKFLDRIFDIYFTTKESSGGTGIGLHMSKNIIEKNMGGTLSVRNVGEGARFRIELDTPQNIKEYYNCPN
jgi:PAS domain S-box-containing protein